VIVLAIGRQIKQARVLGARAAGSCAPADTAWAVRPLAAVGFNSVMEVLTIVIADYSKAKPAITAIAVTLTLARMLSKNKGPLRRK
jgi:hypothetical protein